MLFHQKQILSSQAFTQMKSTKPSRWNNLYTAFKKSFVYRIVQFIISSAAVSLLITLIIFAVEQKEDAERTESMISNLEAISDDLMAVQNSVATRYLGVFPDYLNEVNNLLEQKMPKDSIVIFEDVLYYGILSDPEAFINMNRMLLSHADEGGHVTIAYYNPDGMIFHRMVRESRISPEYFVPMDVERDSLIRMNRRMRSDEEICEKYFALTRQKDPVAFERNVKKYLAPLYRTSSYDDELSHELDSLLHGLDSVKTAYLGGKPVETVTFMDYESMYKGMTRLLEQTYLSHGVELIPLNEYLTMTCWLVSGQAVLAFPSKYATEEIGFYSKDPAFGKYINTMLDGVRGYYRKE